MAVFTYRAHRLDGGEVAGEIAAGSAREALAAVRERGLFVSSLQPKRQDALLRLRVRTLRGFCCDKQSKPLPRDAFYTIM